MTRALIASTIASLLMFACVVEDNGELRGGRTGAGEGEGEGDGVPGDLDGDGIPDEARPGTTPPAPGVCEGAPHPGFAGFDFVSDRQPGDVGIDRRRVKPFSALASEFRRTLGTVPSGLGESAAAFGQVPARWYSEPTAGAVSLYTLYTLAFTGCYDTMTDARYTTAVSAPAAATECAALQRKFWQRTPTPDETKSCVDLVTTRLGAERLPRRRWAHACASMLSSVGFTSY